MRDPLREERRARYEALSKRELVTLLLEYQDVTDRVDKLKPFNPVREVKSRGTACVTPFPVKYEMSVDPDSVIRLKT